LSNFEEKTVSSATIFSGKVFDVHLDRALLPDGREVGREVVLHNGGASIVALDAQGCVYLVRQWRYPFAAELLEIPAGKLGEGEDPRECALRELKEETGMVAGRMVPLGDYYATPAYCSEVLHIFLALDLEKSQQCLDDGEFLEVVKMPFWDAFELVMDGEIKDAKTQIGILKASFWLKTEN